MFTLSRPFPKPQVLSQERLKLPEMEPLQFPPKGLFATIVFVSVAEFGKL